VNPWNLTPQQVRVLDALSETGNTKATARALDLTIRAVEEHLYHLYKRMGVKNRLLAVLAWDRNKRGAA
jgi:DNA-binding NarL/FixJ family response regulator